jgi:hypothetical protein
MTAWGHSAHWKKSGVLTPYVHLMVYRYMISLSLSLSPLLPLNNLQAILASFWHESAVTEDLELAQEQLAPCLCLLLILPSPGF